MMPLYSTQLSRGKLKKVLENIERFQGKIREVEYKNTPLITRVSGVLVDEAQLMIAMKKLWGSLVDQISFVIYNPWENVYQWTAQKSLSHVRIFGEECLYGLMGKLM